MEIQIYTLKLESKQNFSCILLELKIFTSRSVGDYFANIAPILLIFYIERLLGIVL